MVHSNIAKHKQPIASLWPAPPEDSAAYPGTARAAAATQNEPAYQRHFSTRQALWPQWRQWERGLTTLSPWGQRLRQTFRKLPKARPSRPAKTVPRMRIMREMSIRFLRRRNQCGRSTQVDCWCMKLPSEGETAQASAPTATDPARAAALFERSVEIMARLRAPGGCPWDREQSFDTIRKYTLEEVYEVFDAIERRDFPTWPRSWAICCFRCCFMRRWRPMKAISRLQTYWTT